LAQLAAFGRPRHELGWATLIAATFALGITLTLRLAPLSFIVWTLAFVSGVALTPWNTFDRPWILALFAIAPLAAAALVRTRTDLAVWRRWDLPHQSAATIVSVIALACAPAADQQPLVMACTGSVCLLAAARWRRIELTGAGLLLIVMGAVSAGHGWGAFALGGVSIIAGAGAPRFVGTTRRLAQLASVATAAGAWAEVGHFLEWTGDDTIRATALAGGVVVLVSTGLARWTGLGLEWTAAWTGTGVLAVTVATTRQLDLVDAHPASVPLAVAAALTMVSLGCGILAPRAPRLRPRELASVVALGAAAELVWAIEMSSSSLVLAGSIAGVVAMTAVLALSRMATRSSWVVPIGIWGWGAMAVSLSAAGAGLPRLWPLGLSLLAAAICLSATGVAMRRVEPIQLAAVTACASWIVFALEADAKTIDWFTAPCGIAILGIVLLTRVDRRRREMRVADTRISTVEFVAMGTVVAPPIVETVIDSPAFGAVAIAWGAALAVWGVWSRVRRRLFFGSATVVVAAVVLVGIPVTRVVARPRGDATSGPIGLWLGLATAGVVALAAAALIEEGRRRVRRAVRRVAVLTDGWE
jgi:hypothetical protein